MSQLYVGKNKPSQELIKPIKNRDLRRKPYGGLWTSTYKSKNNTSGWVEWCKVEKFIPFPQNGWLLCPKKNVNIYIIGCRNDLEKLLPKYIQKIPEYYSLYNYDYEKLQQAYDGIQLTEQGRWDTNFMEPNFYDWDCESTLWFIWCFEKVEYLGEIG